MPHRFLAEIRANPVNAAILDRLPALGVADAWLVAGGLFQTVWNLRSDRPATENIKDYDIFYFDRADLSWEGENAVIARAGKLFADIAAEHGVAIEVKNEARVHLWYASRFGHEIDPLVSSPDAIGAFLVQCTCVGVTPGAAREPRVHAPYGLGDLYAGILRPNPRRPYPELFRAKAASYRARWPWLRIAGPRPGPSPVARRGAPSA